MSAGSTFNCSARIMVAMVSGLLPQNGALSETTILPRGSILMLTPSGELVNANPACSLSIQNSVAENTLRSWQVAMPIPTAALLAIFRLLLTPPFVVQEPQRLVEHCGVITAVVKIAGRDFVGKILRPDKIHAPELDRVETELVDRRIHHPLDDEVGDLRAESAIGALLALVGQHRGDLQVDAADPIWPDDLRQRIAVMADAVLEIGAVVVEHLAAKANHPVVSIERELGIVDAVGAVVVAGGEIVDAVLDVLDRPAADARQRRRQDA